MQLITIITTLGGIYTMTYQPMIAQLRVSQNNNEIKRLYINGQIVLFFTFLIGGVTLLFLGKPALTYIGSKTPLMSQLFLAVAILVSFLETNHSLAGSILLSKNEVPFFKAAIISGVATVLLLMIFFRFTHLGYWSMILAPGIAQLVYQNWKWPLVVKNELKITSGDVLESFKRVFSFRMNSKYFVKNDQNR
jgi:O-antigen/teichoic acid export membrane protein